MLGMEYVIDPEGAALALIEGNGFNVLSPVKSVPAPKEKLLVSSIATEGERSAGGRRGNSQHPLLLRLTGGNEEEFRQRQVQFEQKLYKLDEEGGVLRVIFPDGGFIDWEVRGIEGGDRLIDNRFIHSMRSQDEVTFVCAPFGEGEEELVGEFEGEDRVLECVIDDIGGSAEALARAVVTSPSSDVYDLKWGRDSRRYSSAATAKAYYPAGELTPIGGATETTATVDGKAGTAVVRQGTLTPNWTGMLSTDLDGVGPMTQEGVFEVLVWIHMPTTNTGQVGVGFEYGVGAGPRTELIPVYFEPNHARESKVIQLSLGQVFLRATEQGTHQWDGNVLGCSTIAGDDLDVLGFALRPLEESSGEVSVSPSFVQPAALITRDEFVQTAGNLNGKALAAAQSVSGPKSAGTGADDATIGTVAWSNPGNITASDNTRAIASLTNESGLSHYLKATNFGFALPVGAIVEGILVEIERSGVLANSIKDNAIKIIKGGAVQSTNAASPTLWPASDTYLSYGSSTYLWGAPWLYSDINAANFGVAIAASLLTSEFNAGEARVDNVRITVFYTDAAGQTWSTTGDAVDLAVETTGKTAQRSEVSDADINTGRYAIAGTTLFTDTVVGVKCKRGTVTAGSSEQIRGGVLARYVNTSNWLFFGVDVDAPSSPVTNTVRLIKRVAGTVTELGRVTISDSAAYRRVLLQVDRRGRYFCWGVSTEGIPKLLLAGQDSDLATGGALDDGQNGFYDAKTGALANTRNYDDFVAWIPALDAVIFQGVSLELAHDRVEREALGGGAWAPLTPSGDYLRLAPAAMENRSNRLVFIASSHDPDTMGVGFPSKLKVAVYAKRRWRTIPDPA